MFEQLITDTATRLNLPVSSVSVLVHGLMTLMTGERTGGPAGFLHSFRDAGNGAAVEAWLGGRAAPITPVQVEAVLGPGAIGALAASTGLTRGAVSAAVAYLLPGLIAQLALAGTLPSAGMRPSAVAPPPTLAAVPARPRRWLAWLPFAMAALALVVWGLPRAPTGTLDARLMVVNRNGKVTYSGLVRDDAARQAIVSALRSTFGPANVTGALDVDGNVRRAGWDSELDDLLAVVNVPGTDFSLTGDAISIGGWLTAAERRSLVRLLGHLLGPGSTIGVLGDAAVDAVREANQNAMAALGRLAEDDVVPAAIVQAMNVAVINFASDSAELPQEAAEIIERSADALTRAPPGTRIEIGGHTDDMGDPAANITLSQARAEAVRDALVASGVSSEMLTAAGYGEASPRASNDTEYGRFQNRRIEFSVIE